MNNEIKPKTDYFIGSIHESKKYGPFKIIGLDHINKCGDKYFKVQFLETGYRAVASTGAIRNGYVKDHTYDFDFSIGSIHKSNNYGSFKILGLDHTDNHRRRYFKIQFIKTGYITIVGASEIKSGNIKDHTYDYDYSIGSIHKSNNHGKFKIIEGLGRINGSYKYRVQFIETGYITTAESSQIKHGEIADPLAKTVCGVGYLGVDKIPNDAKRDYNRWYNMISRCNNPNSISYPNYGALGVTVCERWLCFKNYLEDMPNIPGREDYLRDPDNYHLDKDILQQNIPKYQQAYSPETCMFIHQETNHAYKSNTGANNTTGYYGVYEYHVNDNYIAQTNYNGATRAIGVYPNAELAAAAYNQFVLSYGLTNKPLNPVPPITQAQVHNYDLRFGNKIEMCRIIDPSKPKEMCRIINK